AGPGGHGQAGDRRRLQLRRPDARRAARLAAGPVRLQGGAGRRRQGGQGDARDRRRPRNAQRPGPRRGHGRPASRRSPLRIPARHHEGAQEGAEVDRGCGPRRRRRAQGGDRQARDAAQALGWPQGGIRPGARPDAPQQSEGDLIMGNVLLVAEHKHGKFPKTTLVGLSAARQLATQDGGKVVAAVLGQGTDALATELSGYGCDVVAVDGAPFAHYLADAYTAALAEIAKQKGCDTIVATATALGKDLLPRLAARLGAGMASDITAIVDGSTFKRLMWAGNVIATVKLAAAPRVVSVRGTAFDAAAKGGKGAVEKASINPGANDARM